MNFNNLLRPNHQDEKFQLWRSGEKIENYTSLIQHCIIDKKKTPWNNRTDSEVLYKIFVVLEHLLQCPQGV